MRRIDSFGSLLQCIIRGLRRLKLHSRSNILAISSPRRSLDLEAPSHLYVGLHRRSDRTGLDDDTGHDRYLQSCMDLSEDILSQAVPTPLGRHGRPNCISRSHDTVSVMLKLHVLAFAYGYFVAAIAQAALQVDEVYSESNVSRNLETSVAVLVPVAFLVDVSVIEAGDVYHFADVFYLQLNPGYKEPRRDSLETRGLRTCQFAKRRKLHIIHLHCVSGIHSFSSFFPSPWSWLRVSSPSCR